MQIKSAFLEIFSVMAQLTVMMDLMNLGVILSTTPMLQADVISQIVLYLTAFAA